MYALGPQRSLLRHVLSKINDQRSTMNSSDESWSRFPLLSFPHTPTKPTKIPLRPANHHGVSRWMGITRYKPTKCAHHPSCRRPTDWRRVLRSSAVPRDKLSGAPAARHVRELRHCLGSSTAQDSMEIFRTLETSHILLDIRDLREKKRKKKKLPWPRSD